MNKLIGLVKKRCKRCWKKGHVGWHPLTEFYKVNTSRDGLSGNCKRCTRKLKEARESGAK